MASKKTKIALAVAALLVAGGIASSIGGGDDTNNVPESAPSNSTTFEVPAPTAVPTEAAESAPTEAVEPVPTSDAVETLPVPDDLLRFIEAGSGTNRWAITDAAAVPTGNGPLFVAVRYDDRFGDTGEALFSVATFDDGTDGVYNVRAVDGFAKQFTDFEESPFSITDDGARAAKDALG